jgi:hypothetical protein
MKQPSPTPGFFEYLAILRKTLDLIRYGGNQLESNAMDKKAKEIWKSLPSNERRCFSELTGKMREVGIKSPAEVYKLFDLLEQLDEHQPS